MTEILKLRYYLGRFDEQTRTVDILLNYGSFRREKDAYRSMMYVKERREHELLMDRKPEFEGCLPIKGNRILEMSHKYHVNRPDNNAFAGDANPPRHVGC